MEAENNSDEQEPRPPPSLPDSFSTSDDEINDSLWSLLTDTNFDISVMLKDTTIDWDRGKLLANIQTSISLWQPSNRSSEFRMTLPWQLRLENQTRNPGTKRISEI